MPTIGHLENILVENIVAHADLGESVDALLSYLLYGLAETRTRTGGRGYYSARSTDGVILEHSTFSEGGAVARGVVIMIDDQRVEPVHVEFSLDGTLTKFAAGLVYFGDSSGTIKYGSKEDRKLRNAMIAEPIAERSWKERFHRDSSGWHHGAA